MVSDEDEDGCSVVRMLSLCLRWEDTADVRTENKNEAFMVTLRKEGGGSSPGSG